MFVKENTCVADKDDRYAFIQSKRKAQIKERSRNHENTWNVPKYCLAILVLLAQPQQNGKLANT